MNKYEKLAEKLKKTRENFWYHNAADHESGHYRKDEPS